MIIVQNPAEIGQLPIGSIIIWSGIASTIPSGWVLCDGTGSTPNTLGMLIRGATDDSNLLETGGASTHRHTAGALASGGSHSHSYSKTIGSGAAAYVNASVSSAAASNHTHSISGTTNSASHTHTSGGNTGYSSNIPPTKKYYFIMRTT